MCIDICIPSARSMKNMIELQRNGFRKSELEAAKYRIEQIMSDPENKADSIAYVDETAEVGAFLFIMVRQVKLREKQKIHLTVV